MCIRDSELFRAEDEARLAAEAAGRQAAAQDGAEDLTRSVAAGDVPSAPAPAPAPAPEEIGTGTLDEDETSRRQAVDDLFARLRAERHRAGDSADAASGSDGQLSVGDVPGDAPIPPTALPGPGSGAETPSTPSDSVVAAPGSAVDAVGAGTLPDPRLADRGEMLDPVVSTLVRRLKRALQDDQNDILDRVRAGGGWGPDVLPPADEHERRYVAAAIEHLRDAARSGATFAGGKPDDAPPVDAVAGELAAAIVVPLRRRLDGAGGSVDDGDDSALIEHVGAAFRDWKGGRVERLDVYKRQRELMTGMPKTVVLSPAELREAVEDQIRQIITAAVRCLGEAPPELAQDIITQGIHLVGCLLYTSRCV